MLYSLNMLQGFMPWFKFKLQNPTYKTCSFQSNPFNVFMNFTNIHLFHVFMHAVIFGHTSLGLSQLALRLAPPPRRRRHHLLLLNHDLH